MKRAAFLFLALLLAGCTPEEAPMAPCEVGAPYDWKSPLPCSKSAHAMMERMGTCLHLGGEEPYDAERKKFLNEGFAKFRCLQLACDFHDVKNEADLAALKAYITEQYGSIASFEEAQKYPQSCEKK